MPYHMAPAYMSHFIPLTSLQHGVGVKSLDSNPSSATYSLCDLVELVYPLCDLVFPCVKWRENSPSFIRLVWRLNCKCKTPCKVSAPFRGMPVCVDFSWTSHSHSDQTTHRIPQLWVVPPAHVHSCCFPPGVPSARPSSSATCSKKFPCPHWMDAIFPLLSLCNIFCRATPPVLFAPSTSSHG